MSNLNYTETRKARKEHTCYWCRDTIKKGDMYNKKVQTDGGDFMTFKECHKCVNTWQEYWDATDYDYDYSTEDSVHEWWREEKCPECINYGAIPCETICEYYSRHNPFHCRFFTVDGLCTAETCCNMTHSIRCEKFKGKD